MKTRIKLEMLMLGLITLASFSAQAYDRRAVEEGVVKTSKPHASAASVHHSAKDENAERKSSKHAAVKKLAPAPRKPVSTSGHH